MKINWIYALLRRKWWRIICPWENRSEIKYIVLPSREIKLRCISFNLESILPSHQKPKWLLLFVKKQLSMSLDRSLRGPIIEALCCQLTMYTILGMIRERQLLLNQLIKPKNIDTWQFFSTLYRLTMTDHGKDHENITWWLSRCSWILQNNCNVGRLFTWRVAHVCHIVGRDGNIRTFYPQQTEYSALRN